jgi:SAM-dependent methyltransferase
VADPVNARLRTTFDEDAGLYDRIRPGYPPQVFTDLAELAGVGPGCRLLEIGAGTGKATLPLARLGCRVTAVELGPNMATVAAGNLAGFPDTEVVVSAFEAWPLPAEPFDVVLSATAFHWVDPRVRVAKAADALRVGGALAVVGTHHVAGGTDAFFIEAQECYERFDPATRPGLRLPGPDEITIRLPRLVGCHRFGPAVVRRYQWQQAYPTAEYLDLLRTYSGHRALPEPNRGGLLECIADLIDSRYAGRITKRYLTQLHVAHLAS